MDDQELQRLALEGLAKLRPTKASTPALRLVASNPKRERPLSDGELVAIRRMLAEHAKIMHSCPLARRLGDEMDEAGER